MATEVRRAAGDRGYVQPEIDVAALAALLDGKYAEVRDLVRTNLVDPRRASSTRRSRMGRDDFRERVRDARGRDGGDRPDRHGLPRGVRRRR